LLRIDHRRGRRQLRERIGRRAGEEVLAGGFAGLAHPRPYSALESLLSGHLDLYSLAVGTHAPIHAAGE